MEICTEWTHGFGDLLLALDDQLLALLLRSDLLLHIGNHASFIVGQSVDDPRNHGAVLDLILPIKCNASITHTI
jgi:hypothetical protein